MLDGVEPHVMNDFYGFNIGPSNGLMIVIQGQYALMIGSFLGFGSDSYLGFALMMSLCIDDEW